MAYQFVDDPAPPQPQSGRFVFVDQASPTVNPATDFGGDNLQVWNPATLWNPHAQNLDTGVPLSRGMNNFLAGAGKAYEDTGRGLRQIYANAADYIAPQSPTLSSLVTGQKPSRSAQIQQEIDESKKLDAPLMQTGAGLAGDITGNLALTVGPIGAAGKLAEAGGAMRLARALQATANPTTWRAAAGSGALQAGLAPVASDESRLGNVGVGALTGVAGNVIPAVAGRIAQPIKSALSDGGQAAVKALTAAGVPLDLAQRTGSKALGKVKSFLYDNPVTAGKQKAFQESQQQGFNRAALAAAGAPDFTRATPEALNTARSASTDVMNDVGSRTAIPWDTKLESGLSNVEADTDVLSPAARDTVTRYLNDITTKATNNGGALTGEAYQRVNTRLVKALASGTSSPDAADMKAGLGAVKDVLDDALERNASPQDLNALLQARQQYRTLKQIEPAVTQDAERNVSAAKLVTSLSTKANRNQRLYGQGPQQIVDLAEAGKIIGDPNPNSGTFGRHLMGGLTAAGGVGALEGLDYLREGQMPNMGTLGGIALGGILAPKYLMQPVMNSQALGRYLAGGITPGLTRSALQAPNKSLLVNALMRRALPGYLLSNSPEQGALPAAVGQ